MERWKDGKVEVIDGHW